ncbi:MAG: SMC-Scp complex subunit ScpB [Alicyclobacillus sp.]|nr:SMC-Scp complex subunit ScpB [Alicyclobacillus sp.]
MPPLAALEAVLFAAGSDGLTSEEVAHIMQLSVNEAVSLCRDLQKNYDERGAGLALVELAGQWQMVTRPEHAIYLRRMATVPTSATLSSAALEVLALVAYRQPISRLEIEAIRGVQSDRALSTLVHRQLVKEVGRQDAPGRPILYGTTDTFLQTFGLRSLADLPPLPDEPDLPENLALFPMPPLLTQD